MKDPNVYTNKLLMILLPAFSEDKDKTMKLSFVDFCRLLGTVRPDTENKTIDAKDAGVAKKSKKKRERERKKTASAVCIIIF